MSFPPALDAALGEFCRAHGLRLSTQYRDDEVRSIQFSALEAVRESLEAVYAEVHGWRRS